MAAWNAIVLLAALAGADETVLLQFSTTNCEPCKLMEPVVRRLASDGYPVQQINADTQPLVARQFRVDSFPTFVLVQNGREQGRIVGAASYDRLVQLFPGAQAAMPAASGRAHAANEPPIQTIPQREPTQPRANPSNDLLADVRAMNKGGEAPRAERRSVGGAEQAAYRATIRLKVEDAKGLAYGTGTIIDTHGEEALAVTCGHLFRESRGQGKISIDLFAEGQPRTVAGSLVDFDLERDIALVSLRPGMAITPVQVAPAGFQSRKGERVFSIGCDKGANPSVRASTVSAVNKYMGHPNVTVKGQPVDGRSGGGLFTIEGQLIGVCNAADPTDDEGLYANWEAIHWQLDRIGQQAIYRRTSQAIAATPVSAPPPATTQLASDRPPPALPARMPTRTVDAMPVSQPATSNVQAINSVAEAASENGEYEMICIVRPKNASGTAGQVFVVDHATPQLVQQLARTSRVLSPERDLAGATAALTQSATRMSDRFQANDPRVQKR